MAGHGQGDTKKVVVAALAGNAAIAIAKFAAAFFSGSIAMLAEAVHSLADTGNQALLFLGMQLSKKEDLAKYPLGRAKESYFWSFMVALLLFFLGGVYAIYEGVHKLAVPDESAHGTPIIAIVVLAISLVFEGMSFSVAWKEFSKQRGKQPTMHALFHGKDPTIPIVLLEDTGALLGLVVAMIAVVASWLTGSSTPDALGSIVIGILLCSVGTALAVDVRSLLIGEGVTPETRKKAVDLALATPGVRSVTQILTYHLGPDTVLLALKVGFESHTTVEEVERIINDLEERVRRELPEMKRIFVEPDSEYVAPNPAISGNNRPPAV